MKKKKILSETTLMDAQFFFYSLKKILAQAHDKKKVELYCAKCYGNLKMYKAVLRLLHNAMASKLMYLNIYQTK